MDQIAYVALYVIRRLAAVDELLLARRSGGRYMGGTWQLISGRIEAGETAWQAALRELCEETGLQAIELYQLMSVHLFYRADIDAVCQALPFAVIVDASTNIVLNAENTEFAWVDVRTADVRLIWPNDRAQLEVVRTHVLQNVPLREHLRVNLPR